MSFSVNLAELQPVKALMHRIGHLPMGDLLELLGSEAESQTRRRIGEEKTDPAGDPWDEWSEAYAAHRPKKGGLLQLGGGLLDSISYSVDGDDAVSVGSNLVYAATQQYGRENEGGGMDIPARPYVGVSDENLVDLGDLTIRFIQRKAKGR